MQLSTVSRLAGGDVHYPDLADAIARASERQKRPGP